MICVHAGVERNINIVMVGNKKYLLVILFLLSITSCSTVNKQVKSYTDYSYAILEEFSGNTDNAIKYFLKALKNDNSAQIYLKISDCYLQKGNFEEAISYIFEGINNTTNNKELYNSLANIYLSLNNYQRALECFYDILKIDKNDTNAYLSIALINSELERTGAAISNYNKVISIDSNNIQAYYYLGNLYYEIKNNQLALENYRNAYNIMPENPEIAFAYAYTLKDTGNYETALEIFNSIKNDDEYGMQVLEEICNIYYLKDEKEDTLDLALKIVKESSFNNEKFDAMILEIREEKGAENKFLNVIRNNIFDIESHYGIYKIYNRKGNTEKIRNQLLILGKIFYSKQNFIQAKHIFNLLKSVEPYSVKPYSFLSVIYEEEKKYESAINELRGALKIEPDNIDLINYLGTLYEDIENYNSAEEQFMKVIKLNITNIKPYLHLGYIYDVQGKTQQTINIFKKALEQNDKDSKLHFLMGISYYKNNEFEEAMESFLKSISIDSNNAEVYYHLGIVYDKFNMLYKAIDSFKKTIALDDRNSGAYNYLGYLMVENNYNLEEAIYYIEKALFFEPANGAYLDSLGWAFYKKGDLDKSIENLQCAIIEAGRVNSHDPIIYDHLGDAYYKNGDLLLAIEQWKKVIEMDSKNSKVLEKLNKALAESE